LVFGNWVKVKKRKKQSALVKKIGRGKAENLCPKGENGEKKGQRANATSEKNTFKRNGGKKTCRRKRRKTFHAHTRLKKAREQIKV